MSKATIPFALATADAVQAVVCACHVEDVDEETSKLIREAKAALEKAGGAE